MRPLKLLAIGIIFIWALIFWMILGATTLKRTDKTENTLRNEIITLFGGPLDITTPLMYYKEEVIKDDIDPYGKKIQKIEYRNTNLELINSNIILDVKLDPRKKGVLWFPTYRVNFFGNYVFNDNLKKNTQLYFLNSLKSKDAVYNNINLMINGAKENNIIPLVKNTDYSVNKNNNGLYEIKITYDSTGLEQILYYISESYDSIEEIKNFTLVINTDFKDIDFPTSTISPTNKEQTEKGWKLTWAFSNSVTGKDIGLKIPVKLNPGDITSRVTFFAPISLLFYFIIILIVALMTNVNVHPMNYFFLAASFFSFHLMYSYFSDSINIYLAFAIASAVSVFLTSSYLKLFTSAKFAFFYSGLSQIIYLVMFSYSFFFEGKTGLILTIVSVITLFVLMQLTGKINWDEKLGKMKPEDRK